MNSVIEGKPDVVRTADHRAARRGPPADRGRPGRRQDDARQGARPVASTARCGGSSSPPTCCPATSPASASSTRTCATSSSGPGAIFANVVVGDEINRASPKTQSALLECMEEAPGHRRRHDLRAAQPVHGHGHPEPDRDGGHLPAARGAARPLHGAHLDGLPLGPQPSSTCSTCTAGVSPLEDLQPGHRRRHGRRDHRDGARGARRPGASSSTSSTSPRHPLEHRRCAWARPRAPPAPAARRRGPTRPWPGATTCCPTTSSRSPSPVLAHRLIPTGETQLARRSTADVLGDLLQRVRVPAPHPLRHAVRRLRRSSPPAARRSSASGIVLVAGRHPARVSTTSRRVGVLLRRPHRRIAPGRSCDGTACTSTSCAPPRPARVAIDERAVVTVAHPQRRPTRVAGRHGRGVASTTPSATGRASSLPSLRAR